MFVAQSSTSIYDPCIVVLPIPRRHDLTQSLALPMYAHVPEQICWLFSHRRDEQDAPNASGRDSPTSIDDRWADLCILR